MQGALAVVGWVDQETRTDHHLGRLVSCNNDVVASEKNLTLWIGSDTENVSCKVIFINLPLKTRSSTSKRKRDVSLVLPVTNAALEIQHTSRGDSLYPGKSALSVDYIHLALSLDAFPYAVMPLSRRPTRKPLDDMPGYLVECMKSLTKTKKIDIFVAKSSDGTVDAVFQDLAAAAHRKSLHDPTIDLNTPDSCGQTRGVNRWDLYPVTTDDLRQAKAGRWNPYIDEDPPKYTERPALGLGLGPLQEEIVEGSPDEKIGWGSPPKRKASASPPHERVNRARLEELTQATEPMGTAEMLELYHQAKAALCPPTQAASSPSSASANPSTASTFRHYRNIQTFNCPTLRAPSTSKPVTSIWRMQFSKENSIFFDMVSLLQKALRREPRTHELHLSGFLALGRLAREAVVALTAQEGTTTPLQDSTYAAFVGSRDDLMRRLIVDVANADCGRAWNVTPFPRDPVAQVEYLRGWMNERVQVFVDTDVLDELGAMTRAATKLREHSPLGMCNDDDPVLCEFEWARAAVLGAVFFHVGDQPLMVGREGKSPVMWGRGWGS